MSLGSIFSAGKKPSVPKFLPISAQAEQGKAVGANLANFGDMTKLSSEVNQYNQDQLLSMLRSTIPGYDKMVQGVAGNINSQLNGEIPADVQALIQRKAASKSLTGGYGGSGMARNLEARDLGLTSLQLTQQGLNNAESWIANARQYQTPSMMDVSSMFITPQQQIAQSTYERDAQWNRNWLAAKVKAMPDPKKVALGGLLDAVVDPLGLSEPGGLRSDAMMAGSMASQSQGGGL
jgi:hypothetical protein